MEKAESENIYKIIILESTKRRLFHPKQPENILEKIARHRKTSGTKRCLFGKADPDDTKRMLKEQYALDQQRFFTKFGFDIDTIEHLERSKNDARENIENDRNGQNREPKTTTCGNVKNLGRKILKARRKVCFNKAHSSHSQQYITDFYQARKSSLSSVENKSAQQQQHQQTSRNMAVDNNNC